eukprot:CAMPEP_0169135724 /NCGR_PEP_ID=MMETSP1015-20121227/40597_1 /TAXON_ID=342587 /ORGANISM="Karlodinium micrum, Strain CCMP2283" /LENGTH=45 /DNA_ID= /DNA_START= /DNA_END= /DNA_ORIENTATION=
MASELKNGRRGALTKVNSKLARKMVWVYISGLTNPGTKADGRRTA